jgi:hypothetical protein
MRHQSLITVAVLVCLTTIAFSQDPKAAAPKPLSPSARLAAAKTAYLKNAGGSEIPFNVISEGVQGWGRYQIVGAPERSDIIIEVTSPSGVGGVSVSSSTSTDPRTGMPANTSTSTSELSVARITLIVYDSKSKMALWSSSEQPKGAVREKARQDNVVRAAQHLVTKFRQRVEPDASK